MSKFSEQSAPFDLLRGYLQAATWFSAAVLLGMLFLLPLALGIQGLPGVIELISAVAICLFTGLAVLGVSLYFARGSQVLTGVLLAMVLRMLPPLVVCFCLSYRGSGADYLGFICYLLVMYMLTLALETGLTVRVLGRPNQWGLTSNWQSPLVRSPKSST